MVSRTMYALAVLVIVGLLTSACAPAAQHAPTQPPATQPSEATEAAQPTDAPAATSDQCVRIAGYESSGEKMSMDPAVLYSGHDATFTYAVYERLVNVTSNFEVIPELAETWESNEDATEWTFHLRKGVKFHDGHELTADDVVHTYQRILDPATGSSAMAILSTVLTADGIIAKDPYTVVFQTAEPAVELPLLLTTKETGIVSKDATSEDLRLHGNGTGPFMQDHFEPGDLYTRLVANPDYWQEGLPKAACLELRVISEATTAAAAIQGGDVDILLQVNSAVLPVLQADPNIKLMETGAGNSMTLSFFTDVEPFDDIRVRTALKKIVDREEMVQTVLLGYGEAGADSPVPISDPASYVDEAPQQDIEGAKALLAEAGYDESNPLTLELFTSEAIPGHPQMAQVFKEQAAEAGVEVNITVTPAESFWDAVWLKQPFVTSAWSRRPAAVALGMAYTCQSEYPETHWCRPEFDELLAKAGNIVDDEERMQAYRDLQRMIAEDGGLILPIFVHAVAAMRTECSGWEPHVQNFNLNYTTVECK